MAAPETTIQVRFWGVRGSYAVPGPATNRHGGNTACVEIAGPGGSVIVDAGTGIRLLGKALMAGPAGRGQGVCHLLISHTHWDHIQGLPFFAPLYVAGNRVEIHARARDVHLGDLFRSQTQEPYFAASVAEAPAEVVYRDVMEGQTFSVGAARVTCARLNHPYVALGYRVELGGRTVVYVSDTGPFDRMVLGYAFVAGEPGAPLSTEDARLLAEMRGGVVDLCRGADLVIYDTMFEPDEYARYPHWGHSTPDQALAIVAEAGARCLALFHHHPERGDDAQDAVLARARAAAPAGVHVVAAREGVPLAVGAAGVTEGGGGGGAGYGDADAGGGGVGALA